MAAGTAAEVEAQEVEEGVATERSARARLEAGLIVPHGAQSAEGDPEVLSSLFA